MWMLWELIQPFAGYLAIGLTALVAWWGKGKLGERKGRKEERARRDAADAKETIKAHEVRNEVDADASRGNARDRLRADWRE